MNAIDMAYQQGWLDALSGLENKTRYRLQDKRQAYVRGYREGLKEKQIRHDKASLQQLSDEDRDQRQTQLKKLKTLLTK